MFIYTTYVTKSHLISPINGYTCKRITKQNVKSFGFDSFEQLQKELPDFPFMCEDYKRSIGKDPNGLRKEGISNLIHLRRKQSIVTYEANPKTCPKCEANLPFDKRNNQFCSRQCANSKTHSEETKAKIGEWAKSNPRGCIAERIKDSKNRDLTTKYCMICDKEIIGGKRKTCSNLCYKELRRSLGKQKTEIQQYRSLCSFTFNVYEYPEEFDLYLIEEFGWYKAKNKGNNLNGISRDHIISVRYGFDNNMDPFLLSHPANCKLMRHRDNFSKFTDCGMSIEQLKEKISIWEFKYGGPSGTRIRPNGMQIQYAPNNTLGPKIL
jgi:hypothetical protein